VADNTRVGLRAALSDLGPMNSVTVCFGGRAGQRRSSIETVNAWLRQLFFEFWESGPSILSQWHGRRVMHDTLMHISQTIIT